MGKVRWAAAGMVLAGLLGVAPGLAQRQRAPTTVEDWLRLHPADRFQGKTWVRVQLLEPAAADWAALVDCELNPYTPVRQAVGTVSARGLKPRDWSAENDWGRPLAWYPPADPDWLKAGQPSVWTPLPVSAAPEWFTAVMLRTRHPIPGDQLRVRLEFSTDASPAGRFCVIQERPDRAGTIVVRMPSSGGEAGLRKLTTVQEWANRRLAQVRSLPLGAPPVLRKLVTRSYLQLTDYRAAPPARVPNERLETELQIFQQLGLNSVVQSADVDLDAFATIAQRRGVIRASHPVWAEGWRYTAEAREKEYDYRAGETVPVHWRRVFDQYYRRAAATLQQGNPFLFRMAHHLILGDEIVPPAGAEEIRKTPPLLTYYRQWIREQGVTPQVAALGEKWAPALFGVASWDQLDPEDRLEARQPPTATPVSLRRYYWTRRFVDHYTALYYSLATRSALRHFPHATTADVNYQAGPCQIGFLGNSNAQETTTLDLLDMGRQKVFQGVMSEDWFGGRDYGEGCCLFGAELLRAAARKHQLPLSMYLVGTDPYLRYYLYLMQGFQEIDFYQYGPYSNVGPAWGEDRGTLLQIGKATREIAPYEELLCAARRRPTRAALLVAYTTDVMQKHGPGFGPERQGLYLALHHSGIPVDVVGETDLVNDNLLQQYSVLYVTDPVVRLDVQRKILDWVRGGGHLWAGAGALGWDEYGRISRVLWPAFGVQEYDVRVQPAIGWGLPFFSPRSIRIRYHPRGLLKASGGAGALSLPHDVIAWGIRGNLPPSTGKVLARFDDGKPGALQNQYGKGMVWTIGVLAGEAYARRHWRLGLPPARLDFASGTAERALVATAAAAASVSPPVKLSVPGLYSSVLDAPGATLVFLVNASTRPVKQLTVALAGAETVGKVESLRQGILPHRVEQGRLVVDVPLQDVELLVLRRK